MAEQRVVLEHEADIALLHRLVRGVLVAEEDGARRSGVSSPAISRSSVVLPEPDGPSSAISSPERMSSETSCSAGKRSNSLRTLSTRTSIPKSFRAVSGRGLPRDRRRSAIRATVFSTSVTSASTASSEATAKAAGEIVLVVEDFDMQRHGVGLAANVARHHRHRAELAHGAGIAEQHAVEQAPFDVGQRHVPEGLPAAGAERQRRFLVAGALLLHQRDQFARDEREGDEDRGEHDAGHREDDLDAVRLEPRPEEAAGAEQQHVDQARDHRRHREGQVDQRGQEGLALELELGDRPGGGDAEDQVERHGDRRDQQRQPDRRQRVGIGQRLEDLGRPVAERLDRRPRSAAARRNTARKTKADADQEPARQRRFAGRRGDRRRSGRTVRHDRDVSHQRSAAPGLDQVDDEQHDERDRPA